MGKRKSAVPKGNSARKTAGKPHLDASAYTRAKDSEYVHYEFGIFQDHHIQKADIVAHSITMPKVFTDAEVRQAEYREEDGLRWVGNKHYFPLAVDLDLLNNMFDDGLTFTVFDTKAMVSSRARFDKPKPSPGQLDDLAKTMAAAPDAGEAKDALSALSLSSGVAGANAKPEYSLANDVMKGTVGVKPNKKGTSTDEGVMVRMNLRDLFAGKTEVEHVFEDTESLGLTRIRKIKMTVSLDRPLLSDKFAAELNPLVIHMEELYNMPSTPVSFSALDRQCKPAYVKFSAFGEENCQVMPVTNRSHGPVQTLDQNFVLLTSRCDAADLGAHFLEKIQIEIHDRDRRPDNKFKNTSIFGTGLAEDTQFNDFKAAVGVSKKLNVLEENPEALDPFGVATLDLHDLLAGVRNLTLELPILPGPRHNTEDAEDEQIGVHAGHYVQTGAYLRVKLKLTKSLAGALPPQLSESLQNPGQDGPFARIVYICDEEDTGFFEHIKSFVNKLNTTALELDRLSVCDLDTARETYDLNNQQQLSPNLDIVTGFHVGSPSRNITVIEGLAAGNIGQIWESLPLPESPRFRVLYNSTLRYQDRLYGQLGPTLANLSLGDEIEDILARPEVYISGGRAFSCFTGLNQLAQLFGARRLQETSKSDLLPAAAAIVRIGECYGVTPHPYRLLARPSSRRMSVEVPILENVMGLVENLDQVQHRIDASNLAYDQQCQQEAGSVRGDFIGKNVGLVGEQSYANTVKATEEGRNRETIRQEEGLPVHNYSSQTFNATRLATERLKAQLQDDIRAGRLRPELTKDWRGAETQGLLLTYDQSGEFHHSAASGILLDNAPKPGAMNAAKTMQRVDEEAKWLTPAGIDHGATMAVTLLRDDIDPNPPARTVPLPEVLATRKQEFPWEMRRADFDSIVRKSRLPVAIAVNTGATDQGTGELEPNWNTTRFQPDNEHGLSVMNVPYLDAHHSTAGFRASCTGSMTHATQSAAVPIEREQDFHGGRQHLVHNTRSTQKVGRHFHSTR